MKRLWGNLLLGTSILLAFGFGALLLSLPQLKPGLDFMDKHRAVELLLAAFALVFSGVQYRDSKHQSNNLRFILDSIPTTCIGRFPGHVAKIAEIVTTAKISLDIMADCVDYGSFFDPDAHQSLFRAIRQAAMNNVEVRLLVCGRPQPITQNSFFFGKDLSERLDNRDFRRYLSIYLDCLQRDTNFQHWLRSSLTNTEVESWVLGCLGRGGDAHQEHPLSAIFEKCLNVCETNGNFKGGEDEEFTTLLLLRQRYFEEKLKGDGVQVRQQPNEEAIFLWLKDAEREALFAHGSSLDKDSAQGFRTLDTNLLQVFQSIFEDRWAKAVAAS